MRSSDESDASRDTMRCAGVAIEVPGTLFERRRSCLSGEWKLRSIESSAVASDVCVSNDVTEYEDDGLAGLSFTAASAAGVGSGRCSLQEIATGDADGGDDGDGGFDVRDESDDGDGASGCMGVMVGDSIGGVLPVMRGAGARGAVSIVTGCTGGSGRCADGGVDPGVVGDSEADAAIGVDVTGGGGGGGSRLYFRALSLAKFFRLRNLCMWSMLLVRARRNMARFSLIGGSGGGGGGTGGVENDSASLPGAAGALVGAEGTSWCSGISDMGCACSERCSELVRDGGLGALSLLDARERWEALLSMRCSDVSAAPCATGASVSRHRRATRDVPSSKLSSISP